VSSIERNKPGAIGKALNVLDAFGPMDGTLRLTDLADRTGLPKSTVHRVVEELVAWGGLERVGRRFRLGTKLFELGEIVPRHRTLREAALPFMEDLYEATHETVHLAVRDGLDLLYLEKIRGSRPTLAPSRVGGRMPLHCAGVGKAILAFSPYTLVQAVMDRGLEAVTPMTITDPKRLKSELDQVRRHGVALDRQETMLGLVCVAAPLLIRGRDVVGAISVAGDADRLRPELMAFAVRTAALTLSRQLTVDYALLTPGPVPQAPGSDSADL